MNEKYSTSNYSNTHKISYCQILFILLLLLTSTRLTTNILKHRADRCVNESHTHRLYE